MRGRLEGLTFHRTALAHKPSRCYCPTMEEKSTEHSKAWDQYWQGREGEDALVCEGVEDDGALLRFWRGAFSDHSGAVLDIACGSGSVLRLAQEAGCAPLTGLDIAEGAISNLAARVDGAIGVLGSAADLPFDNGAFDLVVSQFGLEYAGVKQAAAEAGRVVANGGSLVLLCHYQGGVLEQDVRHREEAARGILEVEYFTHAKRFFETAYAAMARQAGSEDAFNAAMKSFDPAVKRVQAIAGEPNQPLAAHLLNGSHQLFERRQSYALEDVLAWLSGMEGEVLAFLERMESMRAACLGEGDVREVMEVLQQAGLRGEEPEAFYFAEGEEPGAWILRAQKG